MIRADIFIPTSGRIDALKNCLRSLNAQSCKDFHIILVGLSNDSRVQKLLKSYPRLSVSYIIQNEPGLLAAANLALRRAKRDFFIRIDDDVTTDKDWLKQVVQTFDSNSSIGGVTGPTLMNQKDLGARDLTLHLTRWKRSRNPAHQLLNWLYADVLYEGRMMEPSQFLRSGVFTIGSNFAQSTKLRHTIEATNLEACNWCARTKILKKIGGFNPIYSKGLSEFHEAEAAHMILRRGYKLIFNPKAIVHHHVHTSPNAQNARPDTYHRIQNFIYFYFRHVTPGAPSWRFFCNLLLQNCYYIVKFLTSMEWFHLGALVGSIVALSKVVSRKA